MAVTVQRVESDASPQENVDVWLLTPPAGDQLVVQRCFVQAVPDEAAERFLVLGSSGRTSQLCSA
jgi:hypothetical protein